MRLGGLGLLRQRGCRRRDWSLLLGTTPFFSLLLSLCVRNAAVLLAGRCASHPSCSSRHGGRHCNCRRVSQRGDHSHRRWSRMVRE